MPRTPRAAPGRRPSPAGVVLRLRVAVPVSLVLVTIEVVMTTAPVTAGHWWSAVVGLAALLIAILLTGAAIAAHRRG